jgi:hypothetical protein
MGLQLARGSGVDQFCTKVHRASFRKIFSIKLVLKLLDTSLSLQLNHHSPRLTDQDHVVASWCQSRRTLSRRRCCNLNHLSSRCLPRHNHSCGTDSYYSCLRDTGEVFVEETDVLIVDSGEVDLAAALRCHELFVDAILFKKSENVGGTTTLSGSRIRASLQQFSFLERRRDYDTFEKALNYMDLRIGETGPASSSALCKFDFMSTLPCHWY